MLQEPYYLTSMDPGGITGLIALRIDKEGFTVERQLAEPYDPLYGRTPACTLKIWAKDFSNLPQVFLYEDFHLRPNNDFLADPTALQVIGGVEAWLAGEVTPPATPRLRTRSKASFSRLADMGGQPGCPYRLIAPQEPAQGKHMVTDVVLKRLDLLAYGPHTKDINDAYRHAVSYLTGRKYLPICEQAWPRRQSRSSRTQVA